MVKKIEKAMSTVIGIIATMLDTTGLAHIAYNTVAVSITVP